MYIKRILRVLIPRSPCPCRTPRIPVSFVSRVPVSGDLAHFNVFRSIMKHWVLRKLYATLIIAMDDC